MDHGGRARRHDRRTTLKMSGKQKAKVRWFREKVKL